MPIRNHSHNSIRAHRITVTGVMSAIAFVLMVLEFSLPFVPAFLKFDFSDLPALLTSFSLGPLWGVMVELIKNLLHLTLTTTGGVGELANFLVGTALTAPAGAVYYFFRTRRGAVSATLCGMFFAAAVSFPVNLWITYPFYAHFMPMDAIISAYTVIFPFVDSLPRALLTVNVPFTLGKGLIDAVITFAVYKKLSPLLKGRTGSPKKEGESE